MTHNKRPSQLYEGLDQKLTVARLLSSQSGVFKVKRKIALEIMDGIAKQEMDQIVLTFVVIMAQDVRFPIP